MATTVAKGQTTTLSAWPAYGNWVLGLVELRGKPVCARSDTGIAASSCSSDPLVKPGGMQDAAAAIARLYTIKAIITLTWNMLGQLVDNRIHFE